MAQRALTAGTDGAATAGPLRAARRGRLGAGRSVKALVWLVVIILMLGYIPDRAYYLTVAKTVDLGVLAWSPDQPLPAGEPDAAVPGAGRGDRARGTPRRPSCRCRARTDGAVVQVGTRLLYIGGSDGTTAQSTVYVAKTVGTGNFDAWADGPAAARAADRRRGRVRRRERLRDGRHRRRRRADHDDLRPDARRHDRRARRLEGGPGDARAARGARRRRGRRDRRRPAPDRRLERRSGPVATTWKSSSTPHGVLGEVGGRSSR